MQVRADVLSCIEGQNLVFELKMGVGEIGFVWVCFFGVGRWFIFIILYNIYVCVHFGLSEIGFVLHKK